MGNFACPQEVTKKKTPCLPVNCNKSILMLLSLWLIPSKAVFPRISQGLPFRFCIPMGGLSLKVQLPLLLKGNCKCICHVAGMGFPSLSQ